MAQETGTAQVTAEDIAALPEEEAFRLLYLTPSKAPWPAGTIVQWESNRGQLRVYITNRTDEPMYLDWSKSHFRDALGKTWEVYGVSQEYSTRDTVAPGRPYEESVALVNGPSVLYSAENLGREIEMTLMLSDETGAYVPYLERFEVGMHLDQVSRTLAAEETHEMRFSRGRSISATVVGSLIAAGGIYALADRGLAERDGELDSELNRTRVAIGGGALGLGLTVATASSIRRGVLTKRIEANESFYTSEDEPAY